MDLFRKIFGRKKTATTAAPAPAPEKKRAAAEAAPAPAPKKPKKDNTNVLRRVNQLRDLRGRQALLFTCPTRQERKAASEAFELLQEYAERVAPEAFAAAAAAPPGGSLADALAAEAASSRKGAKIVLHDLGSQGLLYATVDKRVDVVRLATLLAEDAAGAPTSAAAGSKFMVRVMPLQTVGFADLAACVEGAAPLISEAFGGLGAPAGATLLEAEEARRAAGGAAPAGDADDDDDPVAKAAKKAADEAPADPGTAPPRSYAIQLKRRNADSFPKDIAIRALAKLVPPHHPVDLKTPDVTILVEVYKSLCGIAVVEGYAKHKGFNLHACAGKQAAPVPKKKRT